MRFYLTIFAVLILLAGCRGGTSPEALSPDSSNSDVQFPELLDELNAEFARLGIDPDKVAAKVASGNANAVFDLALTVDDPDGEGPTPASGVTLNWTERMLGDYDQNGLVNASDITPLGQNFQQAVTYDDPFIHNGLEYWPTGNPDDGGSGSANWRRARVDGNDDGLVGLSDITTIAQHWNEQLSGYVVQMAVNRGDGELNWTDVDSGNGIAPSIARPSVNNAAPVRYELYIPLGEAQFAHHFRVLPYDADTDERGALSNRADYSPSTADTTPPFWLDTVGITKAKPGFEQVTVEFGTADDFASPPVGYRVYWDEYDPENPDEFDYVNADSMDVENSSVVIDGLTNEQPYRFAVQAFDSAVPENVEENALVIGATPSSADIYPPRWIEGIGLRDLFYGNGMVAITWEPAADLHEDNGMQWQSDPVEYVLYFGPGLVPDLENAEQKVFSVAEQEGYMASFEIEDTEQHRWFLLRARDSAVPANETDNLDYEIGYGATIIKVDVPGPGPGIPAGAGPAGGGGLIYSTDYSHVKLVSYYSNPPDSNNEPPGELWVSIWDFSDDIFTHEKDLMIDNYSEDYNIKVWDERVFDDGVVDILYSRNTAFTKEDLVHLNIGDNSREIYSFEGEDSIALAFLHPNRKPCGILQHVVINSIDDIWFSYKIISLPDVSPSYFWSAPSQGEFYEFDQSYRSMPTNRDVYLSAIKAPEYEGWDTVIQFNVDTLAAKLITMEFSNSMDQIEGLIGEFEKGPFGLISEKNITYPEYYILTDFDNKIVFHDNAFFDRQIGYRLGASKISIASLDDYALIDSLDCHYHVDYLDGEASITVLKKINKQGILQIPLNITDDTSEIPNASSILLDSNGNWICTFSRSQNFELIENYVLKITLTNTGS